MDDETTILVCDDSEDDLFFIRRSFQRAGVKARLLEAHSGQAALDILAGKHGEARAPKLVVLDIKMPGIDGFDVLRWIRSDRILGGVPVLMLSGSDRPEDIETAHRLGANGYVVKPRGIDSFEEFASAVAGYWLGYNRHPERDRQGSGGPGGG